MPVPNQFANVTTSIPLSQLDANFNTPITLGNTAIQLGNTVTTLNNMTLANVTISSVASTFPNSYLANSTATLGNATITLGGTTTSVGNLTLSNVTVSSSPQVIVGTSSVTGNATLTSTAFGVLHQCSGTTVDYTVTLPAASGNEGKVIGFQMSTALTKLVTIDGNASETIDGALTRIMWAGETAVLYCDGTAWTKIGGKSIPMIAALSVNAAQTIATATDTKKTLAVTFGANNCPAAMSDTANSRVVVQRTGKYQAYGSTRIFNISTAANMETRIYLGGSEATISSRVNTAGDYPSCQLTWFPSLSSGNIVELYAKQYTGSNQSYGNAGENCLIVQEIPSW